MNGRDEASWRPVGLGETINATRVLDAAAAICVCASSSSCSQEHSGECISKMKHLSAYLLAVLAGNTSPSSDDLKGILESVGAEADDGRIKFLLSEVNGKGITELIASGREKFASVSCGGGGGGVAVAAPAGGGAAAAAPAAAEAKKEEKVEEKEESDDDMGFSLFD